jgi:phasin family protein
MPTKTPASKRAAPKRTAAKATAKAAAKPARKTTAARHAPSPAPGSEAASLSELLARLGKLELAGLAGRLVSGWRTDLQTLVEANRKSYAGLQDIVGRQMTQIRERVAEIQSVAKVVSVIGPKDSARHLDDLALAAVEQSLADVRELAKAAAQSQREAFDLVHQRVTANIDEVQRLLRN